MDKDQPLAKAASQGAQNSENRTGIRDLLTQVENV